MGQEDLTKQYSTLFESKWRKNLIFFAYDVYRSGKIREIVSFSVWEMFHRTGLFPIKKYLKFNDTAPVIIGIEGLNSLDFNKDIEDFFESREIKITRLNHSWKLLFKRNDDVIFGCLYPDDETLVRSYDNGESVVYVSSFPEKIKSIFITTENIIFVCTKGAVYRSSDDGNSFKKVLDLGSIESFFRHNNAMTETPEKTLIIGEYGNIWDRHGWRNLANLYFSFDNGDNWQRSEFLKTKGTNKHVHVVQYSKILNRVLVADGDNHKRLWIGDLSSPSDLKTPKWKLVNRFHIQMGGYTSCVESHGKVLFGTDYQGGTNFIVESKDGKKFTSRIVPDPYRRSPVDNMVLRSSKNGDEIWANLPYSTSGTKSLLMYSTDGGKSWTRVIEYDSSTFKTWLIGSSSKISNELYFSIEDLKSNTRLVYKIFDR